MPSRHARKRTADEEYADDISETPDEAGRKRVRWDSDEGEHGAVEEGITTQEHSETDESEPEKICLAVNCHSGRIGAAYYDPTTARVLVLDDSEESVHYELCKTMVEQVQPDIVLVSSKADDGCMDVLKSHIDNSDGVFQIRPHKDFIPSKGRDRVLSLRLLSVLPTEDQAYSTSASSSSDGEPRNAYDFMRNRRNTTGDPTSQKWNASIRLANYASIDGSPLCLGSIGSLLDHLSKLRAMQELEDDGIGGLEIRGIEYIALQDVMQINADALHSLQVFDSENHASIHSDKTKEGLSLFGILDNTKTSLGRALLREWLLRPLTCINTLSKRHDAVDCFVRPENLSVCNAMHAHLKGIKNVPRVLSALKSGKGKVSDWQGLVKFAFHTVLLHSALSELSRAAHVEIVKKLSNALEVTILKDIGSSVNVTIDWEESKNAARVCIRPHVDEELDKKKHIYHGIDAVLSKVAERISATVQPAYAAELNVVYFPQLGFLISVPMRDEWRENGVETMNDWSFQFSSESQVYFKSQEMHDLDTHIGDIHSAIVDREIEIAQELLEQIMKYEQVIGNVCDICAELDCLLSFAEASRAYDYCRPEFSDENVTVIKQGRHPLQELVVDTFVPNDTLLIGSDCPVDVADALQGDESLNDSMRGCKNAVMICTGANACGKSVYLKQVALIHYMAQIGCFVPAKSATLGIIDKLFTRIQTRESVSKVQSAFMIDLNQVSLALRNATSRSMVLLDEFGKGTISADGAGLFCGVIKHLTSRGASCPKVLAATHFHEVFREDMLDPDELPVTFVHMQVMLRSSSGKIIEAGGAGEDDDIEDDASVLPGDRITYLYRIGRGLNMNSHAAMCAELFGIPRHIVRRARYISQLLSMHELGPLLDEEMTVEEREELATAEEVCRRFLECNLQAGEREVGAKALLAQILGREQTEDE